MHAAYVEHAAGDDWSQPGALVRDVMDEAAGEHLVSNIIVGALLAGVTEPVLQRAFSYLRSVDKNLGDKVEAGVRAGQRYTRRSGPVGRATPQCAHRVHQLRQAPSVRDKCLPPGVLGRWLSLAVGSVMGCGSALEAFG